MNDENTQKLFEKYPRLCGQRNLSIQESLMAFGFEYGDGWYKLTDELFEKLESAYQKLPEDEKERHKREDPHAYTLAQCKEKFGGGRWYLSGTTEEMSAAIREAEKKSYETCEDCGEPGECRGGGWLRTLCDKHANGRKTYKQMRAEREAAERAGGQKNASA